jgi:hypothetical protein
MSNVWYLVCLDCKEDSGLSINHGDSALVDLWEKRHDILRLFTPIPGIDVEVKANGLDVPIWFLQKHKDHRVRPQNEYGQVLGECHKSITCTTCGGTAQRCKLDSDHAPPCSPTRIDP